MLERSNVHAVRGTHPAVPNDPMDSPRDGNPRGKRVPYCGRTPFPVRPGDTSLHARDGRSDRASCCWRYWQWCHWRLRCRPVNQRLTSRKRTDPISR